MTTGGATSGFSLVETLVVLVVLGFVLGFTGLQFDGYRKQLRVQNKARLVHAHVQGLQLQNANRRSETHVDTAYLAQALDTAREEGANDLDPVVVAVMAPLLVKDDGSCTAGRFEFSSRDFAYALDIAAPFCAATLTRLR